MLLPPGLERRAVTGELRIDGVAALGPAVRGLLARLLLDDDACLAALRGVASREVAVVLGAAEQLPWFEGAIYLYRLPDEPSLLLPTGVQPSLPGAVLLRAFRSHAPTSTPPLAALPLTRQVVSLAEARPLARERLRRALEPSA